MNSKITYKLLFLVLSGILLSCDVNRNEPNDRNFIDDDYFAVKNKKARQIFIQAANASRDNDLHLSLKLLLQSNGIEPNNVMILNTLGSVQCALGDDKSACANFEKALSVNDLDVTTHVNYGNCLGKTGKYKKALNILQQGLSKTNKAMFEYYCLCFNLAVFNYRNGDCKAARIYVEQAKECTFPNEQFENELKEIYKVIDENCP